jgi:hypothetical protein
MRELNRLGEPHGIRFFDDWIPTSRRPTNCASSASSTEPKAEVRTQTVVFRALLGILRRILPSLVSPLQPLVKHSQEADPATHEQPSVRRRLTRWRTWAQTAWEVATQAALGAAVHQRLKLLSHCPDGSVVERFGNPGGESDRLYRRVRNVARTSILAVGKEYAVRPQPEERSQP